VKKSVIPCAVLVAFSLMLAAEAGARDLFVDNHAGDNRFDGTSPTPQGGGIGPFRTITRALRAVVQGDRIILANTGEPYRESITLQGAAHSGLSYQDLRLWGNGATLEGSAPIPRDAWQPVGQGIWRFSPRYKSHQLLFLDGRPADRVLVEPGELTLPTLEPLQWCLFERHIYFRPEQGKTPGEYALDHSALTVGITLHDVRRVTISDLTIQGFQLDGINAHDNVFGATLDGLTCRGNARSGISVGGASRVQIQRCIVGNNGVAQLRTEGHCVVQLVDCQLLDTTAPAIVKEGGRIEGAAEDSDP